MMGLFESAFLMLWMLMTIESQLLIERYLMFLLIKMFKLKICEVNDMMVL
jgi:hypothetical protein